MPVKSHFINNRWTEGNGAVLHSTNPASGEIIWQGRAATVDEIDQAVAAATGAFHGWSGLSIEDRLTYLEAFHEKLSEGAERLSELISLETGKPRWESRSELQSMLEKIVITVDAYNNRCGTIKETHSDITSVTSYRPLGVVAVLGPFNMPGHLPNGHIVPAILAGNTIVFKPSSQTPLVAQFMIELWETAGIPSGVINLVQGGAITGKVLSEHSRLDGLFFTGSEAIGRALHRAFGGYPEKMLVLEMGGNNPLVAYKVANHKAAAYLTIVSSFITAGQRCSCARRLIVPNGRNGDNFVDCLVETAQKIKVGKYTEFPEPFMGPVISDQATEKLLDAQLRMLTQGGKALIETQRLGETGAMISPGIIDVTSVENREDKEFFGPLLQLVRVPDFGSALNEANNTRFGLSAGLLCDDFDYYKEFRRKIKAGVINWNRPTTGASSRMPFGGVGSSGNYRPGGYFTVDQCVYPVASMETQSAMIPDAVFPGLES
ncbi:MAG: succinylglutamate-semialdehyde dehydrogenase [Desulfomonilaceae bacterium]